MKVLNAFSFNMISAMPATVRVEEITPEVAAQLLRQDGIQSAVGHQDTAAVFGQTLDIEVPCNRVSVVLRPGEQVVVGQYSGPRLTEGSMSLPEGAAIKWLLVQID